MHIDIRLFMFYLFLPTFAWCSQQYKKLIHVLFVLKESCRRSLNLLLVSFCLYLYFDACQIDGGFFNKKCGRVHKNCFVLKSGSTYLVKLNHQAILYRIIIIKTLSFIHKHLTFKELISSLIFAESHSPLLS